MAFLNKIMLHLNKATKSALDKSNNTLDKRLFAFLCKMLEADEEGKMICEEIRTLNEDVVYFVLNGTDIRNNERAFVAGMNWAKIDNRLKGNLFFNNTNFGENKPVSETGNRTLIFSTKKESLKEKTTDAEYINSCWNLVWEDYLQLTKAEEEINKRFTFNHWLLNFTKHPLNIGVYWGNKVTENEIDGGYFHLPSDTLYKLGVQEILKEDYNSLQLPKEFIKSIPYDSSLNQVEIYMSEMDQVNNDFNNIGNIGFSVYHVIRSYGCWGGNSFYSIPINYGSESEKRIGVLSVCAKKPLDERAVERWSLVANKIFKDIILHEIDLFKEFERKNRLIEATYGIGHLFGNAIEDVETPFTALKGYADYEKKPNDTIKNIRDKIKEVEIGFTKLKDISKILHILAKALREKDSNIFERSGWHSKKTLDFYGMIKSLENKDVDGKKCTVEFAAIDAITLVPFINDNKILPAKFIYENMLLELLINCMKHHSDKVKEKKMIVRNENGRLIFRNTAKQDDIMEWGEVNEVNSGGAILYFAYLFRETKIGNIYRKRVKENEDYFFEIGIELSGINIIKNEVT